MRIVIILLALTLSGCATPQTDKVSQLVYYAKLVCKFEPTIAVAASLINAAAGATISSIGDALCNTVTTMPLADGAGRRVKLYGVEVRGRFVR